MFCYAIHPSHSPAAFALDVARCAYSPALDRRNESTTYTRALSISHRMPANNAQHAQHAQRIRTRRPDLIIHAESARSTFIYAKKREAHTTHTHIPWWGGGFRAAASVSTPPAPLPPTRPPIRERSMSPFSRTHTRAAIIYNRHINILQTDICIGLYCYYTIDYIAYRKHTVWWRWRVDSGVFGRAYDKHTHPHTYIFHVHYTVRRSCERTHELTACENTVQHQHIQQNMTFMVTSHYTE